jgi:hypothetical protein
MPTNRRANGFRPSLSIWRVAACAFCLLGLYLTPAAAADVPKLNVEPLWHGIADQGDPLEAGDPAVSFKQCMDSEQADKAKLEQERSTFSAGNRQNCTDEARTGGESSYTDLLTCLEMARDVENDRSQQTRENN